MKCKKIIRVTVVMFAFCMAFWGIREIHAQQTEPQDGVPVIASVYRNGAVLFDGATGATMTAEVPYFDLDNYDLGEYEMIGDDGNTLEKPTLLHGMIYLIEKYCLQSAEADLGTGVHKDAIFDEEKAGELKYYADEAGSPAIKTIEQSGGTMLSIDSNGAVNSLWGFDDHEIRIYHNQKQQKKNLHEVLLEDLNVIEFMLISEDNTNTVLYPRFNQNTFKAQVGESVEAEVSYYTVDKAAYSHTGGASLYRLCHMDGLESIDVNISGDSSGGTALLGPFGYPGIYKAQVIIYPYYFKQLIEVRDTIESVKITGIDAPVGGCALDTVAECITNGIEAMSVMWTSSGKTVSGEAGYLTEYTAHITISGKEYYDFAEAVTVTVGGDAIATDQVVKNEDGTLTITVSYPRTGEMPVIEEESAGSTGSTESTEEPDTPEQVHSYEWVVTKKATANYTGTKSYQCVCGCGDVKKTATINATGKYKVTYKLNGGTNHVKNPQRFDYSSKKAIKLYSPKRAGYKFAGWYTNKKFTKKSKVTTIKKKTKKNVTLYAKWTKVKYKITYKLNKGKNNKKNPKAYYVTTKTIKLKNPTRKGFKFVGWYSDKKLTKKVTKIPKGSIGKITLYAKWVKK